MIIRVSDPMIIVHLNISIREYNYKVYYRSDFILLSLIVYNQGHKKVILIHFFLVSTIVYIIILFHITFSL